MAIYSIYIVIYDKYFIYLKISQYIKVLYSYQMGRIDTDFGGEKRMEPC